MEISSGVKCINKFILILGFSILFLTGCGNSYYSMPYTADSNVSSFRIVNLEGTKATANSFAQNLCIVDKDINAGAASVDIGMAACLFDLNENETLYSKSSLEKMYPASLTKIMTAIVALKYGSPDMILTASSNVIQKDPTSQTMNLNIGDQLTLDQALHVLLMYSANDVAIMIAEGIAGNVDDFVKIMNDEARLIGATNTQFANPHGLSDDNHYTTAYDMYLIANAASRYELFNEIIHTQTYHTVYYNSAGNEQNLDIKNTNQYISGSASAPAGITIIGGKTGTTNAAGNCLVLFSRDVRSKPYISVVMKAKNREDLYATMNSLLSLISN